MAVPVRGAALLVDDINLDVRKQWVSAGTRFVPPSVYVEYGETDVFGPELSVKAFSPEALERFAEHLMQAARDLRLRDLGVEQVAS